MNSKFSVEYRRTMFWVHELYWLHRRAFRQSHAAALVSITRLIFGFLIGCEPSKHEYKVLFTRK